MGKRKAFGKYGPMWKITVGAVNANPLNFTSTYRAIFDRAGHYFHFLLYYLN